MTHGDRPPLMHFVSGLRAIEPSCAPAVLWPFCLEFRIVENCLVIRRVCVEVRLRDMQVKTRSNHYSTKFFRA